METIVAQPIDFSKLGGPVFVGRANGAQARQKLKLDQRDQEPDPIQVRIPEDAYALNSSFFLGLFGPSIARFDSRERFFTHYRFDGPEHIVDALYLVVERALASRGKLALTA
jgi:hypothetical protein